MQTSKPYVLLAEDDYDDVMFFKEALSRHYPDMDVLHFSDGQKVLDFLSACAPDTQPALLLLDFKMPFVVATEVLRQLQLNNSHISMTKAVWTTSCRLDDQENCKALGATYFFNKPVSENEWDTLIARIGRHF